MSSAKGAKGFGSVITAVSGNLFISIIKFWGWWVTGSGSMFSEAVHSLADTGNQALLLVGINRSCRQPDENFNYGYGQERFVWALISACGIFFLGAGVTIYHGVHAFIAKESPEFSYISLLILLISQGVEGVSFAKARRESNEAGHIPFKDIFRKIDPTILGVLLEDAVALLGNPLAAVGIILTHLTGKYYWDAGVSIFIGIIMGVMAIVLARISIQYLIEKAMPIEMKKEICAFLETLPAVARIDGVKSSLMDLDSYRMYLELKLSGTLTEGIGKRIDEIKTEVKKRFPQVKYLKIELCD